MTENEKIVRFFTTFTKSINDIQRDYAALSNESKARVDAVANQVLSLYGMAGFFNFLQNPWQWLQ